MKKTLLTTSLLIIIVIVGRFIYIYLSGSHYLEVKSQSMLPTLKLGQSVKISHDAFINQDPVNGDIVAFSLPVDPKVLIISRVRGIPGDIVTVDEADGLQLTLKDREYFLVGDNKEKSMADSRNLGPIHRDQIKGKILIE